MKHPFRRRLATVLFLLLCGIGAFRAMAQIRNMGNELADVDRYSEANVLREVRNFLEQGLTRAHGLGNVYYPGLYPEDGFAREPEIARISVTQEGIYTHYPPGPEYLALAAAKLFGPEPVSRLRMLPIALGWAAMLFLGFSLRRRFGEAAAWLTMGTLALTPAVTDGFIGLHYQGYAMALLMVEIALTLTVTLGRAPALLPFAPLGSAPLGFAPLAFALLGFAQGWMSFDYAFLVPLVPLAMELCLPRIDPAHQRNWRLAWTRAILAGAGFTAAHGLHFLQVWAYWGSLDAALRDFAGAAAHRAGAELPDGLLARIAFSLGNLKLYFLGLHPLQAGMSPPEPETPENWAMFRFLGLSLGPWWLLTVLGTMLWDIAKPDASNRTFRMDWYIVSLTGILTSSVWILAMANHAGHHRHFLYRHLFFAFFVAVLFGAVRLARAWSAAWREGRRDPTLSLPGGHA